MIASAALAAPALASHARKDGSSHDRVTGAGAIAPTFRFTISAHSGPAGEDPFGTITVNTSAGLRVARVTCLVVIGNQARASGPVVHEVLDPGVPHQNAALVIVEDLPSPMNDLITYTTFAEDPFHVDPDTACLFPAPALDPVVRGNVEVYDG
jgi:hypothetical protein